MEFASPMYGGMPNGSQTSAEAQPTPTAGNFGPYSTPTHGQSKSPAPAALPHTPQQSPQMKPWPVGQYAYQQPSSPHMSKEETEGPKTGPIDPQLYPSLLPSAVEDQPQNGSRPMPEYGMQPPYMQQPWQPKGSNDIEGPQVETDLHHIRSNFFGNEEDFPIVDLRFDPAAHERGEGQMGMPSTMPRRPSESSHSMSSSNIFPDMSSYEAVSTPESMPFHHEGESWPKAEHGPALMSPMNSPKVGVDGKPGSRSKAPSPPRSQPSVRSSPYSLESPRHKRWSAPTSTPNGSRAVAQMQDRFASYGQQVNPHHSMPPFPFSHPTNLQHQTQNVLYSTPTHLQATQPNFYAPNREHLPLEVPRPLPSQGLFRLLQSNGDRQGGCASHFADLSDPPDLFSSLREDALDPPESDMNPEDPDMVPHEQDLRFTGDMYTPRWVRGHGNKREGWCGLCKPGRWLVLKNSAFWYDKSFTHGISAATGSAFQSPQDTRRTEGNPDVWEGLCGSCGDWVALVSSKKKGTTWFRHAYRCHTHAKVKDGPKRRRETASQVRARAISGASSTSSAARDFSNQSTPGQQHSSLAGDVPALSHVSTPHMATPHMPPHASTPHMHDGAPSPYGHPGMMHHPHMTPQHHQMAHPYHHERPEGLAGLGLSEMPQHHTGEYKIPAMHHQGMPHIY